MSLCYETRQWSNQFIRNCFIQYYKVTFESLDGNIAINTSAVKIAKHYIRILFLNTINIQNEKVFQLERGNKL